MSSNNTQSEIDIINKKVDSYRQYRGVLETKIKDLIGKIKISSFSESDKNTISQNLNEIKTSMMNIFVHYEEIGFAEYFEGIIDQISSLLEDTTNNDKPVRIKALLNDCKEYIVRYAGVKEAFKSLSSNALSEIIAEVNKELLSFRRLRNIADTALTEKIYNSAVIKYQDLESNYRKYFYGAIAILLVLSIGTLLLKNIIISFFSLTSTEFWVLKGTILIVGVTLISYFIKQSSHYQKLADQNYQTQVELQAFPSFMENIPQNEAALVRKELALRYFGKEIDSTPHKDMANLMSEQIKNSSELVKATTESIKNLRN